MLGRNLDSDSTAISKIDHKILSRTALLLSKRTSPRAESKTKRAEKNAANNGTARDASTAYPLHVIGSGLNARGHNVARTELLSMHTATVESLIGHAPVTLDLDNAGLGGAETVGAVLRFSLHGDHSTHPPRQRQGPARK